MIQSDNHDLVNPILRQVMKRIYENRCSYPIKYLCDIRLERIHDQVFSQLFFMSRGCSHDLNGGCTMCNYGYGKEHKPNLIAVLEEINKKIKQLPEHIQEIVVTPIGSLMDEDEIPVHFLIKLLDLLSKIKCNEFTCETRADSITSKKLDILKKKIHAEKITLELGVESSNNWILRNCINKNIKFQTVQNKIQMVHKMGIHICTNIGIGFPFVNEAISIHSAITSIKKLLKQDVSCITLFAYNIRPGTLLEWLWKKGLYKCTSLWAIVEVLSNFSNEELRRIQISWYRNYYKDQSKILQMPYLCSNCRENVLSLFDDYRNNPCLATLTPLRLYDCQCKQKWYTQYSKQAKCIDFLNVRKIYTEMAYSFSISAKLLEQELYYMENSLSEKE